MKLNKRLIVATFALTLAFAPAFATVTPMDDAPVSQAEKQEIKIVVSRSNVRVLHAAKQTLYVYDLSGKCILSRNVDGDDKTFTLDVPKGIYLIKVGDVVRKACL